MELIALADIHGELDFLYALDEILASTDGVLLAGDITNFGGAHQAREVLEQIRKHNDTILGVYGNCDLPEVKEVMEQEGCSIHGQCRKVGGVQFVGVGGSLPCSGATPNEAGEEELEAILISACQSAVPGEPLVLVTHQPAYNIALDSVGNGRHTGSRMLRQFIEKHQPLLALSGHIHEAPGTDTIGSTLCVNPGPLRRGKYARILFNGNTAESRLVDIFHGL